MLFRLLGVEGLREWMRAAMSLMQLKMHLVVRMHARPARMKVAKLIPTFWEAQHTIHNEPQLARAPATNYR